jgi:hypothetical protein
MLKWVFIIWFAVMAVVVFFVSGTIKGQRQVQLHVMCTGIGRQLISLTNSSSLVHLGPDLHAQLATLLSSTTRVSTVLFGDEPPPFGDGKASSRLVLTNAVGHGLLIRLQREPGTNLFRVLSFRSTSE